ncbi:hypothetical protein K1719_047157 [Acacia pycnantha]|nr:hypothetical protein K1719_047157 [Acacia pycnantha]
MVEREAVIFYKADDVPLEKFVFKLAVNQSSGSNMDEVDLELSLRSFLIKLSVSEPSWNFDVGFTNDKGDRNREEYVLTSYIEWGVEGLVICSNNDFLGSQKVQHLHLRRGMAWLSPALAPIFVVLVQLLCALPRVLGNVSSWHGVVVTEFMLSSVIMYSSLYHQALVLDPRMSKLITLSDDTEAVVKDSSISSYNMLFGSEGGRVRLSLYCAHQVESITKLSQ